MAGAALIWTTRFSTADLQAAIAATDLNCPSPDGVHTAVSELDCARQLIEASANATGVLRANGATAGSGGAEMVDTGADENLRLPMLGYHLFGVFWCANFYSAMKTMIIAAAVAEIFWTKAKAARHNPTLDAFCYIFKVRLD